MLPLRLEIENFQIHKKSIIDFSIFNSAIILGSKIDDEDEANGVGKTTILLAIEYVLFGEYQKKLIDKIVRIGTDKARVTFDVDIDGTIYRIQRTRYLKNKNSELLLFIQKNGNFVPLDGVRTSETEQELKKLLKINYTTFRNISFFNQGDLSGLAAAKDSKTRFSILEEALELAEYSKLENFTKKEFIVDLNKKIEINKALIEKLGNPQEQINLLQTSFAKSQTEITDLKNQKSLSESDLVSLNQSLLTLERSFNHNTNKDLISNLKQIELDLADKQNKKIDFTSKLDTKNKELTVLGTVTKQLKEELEQNKKEYENLILVKLDDKQILNDKITQIETDELLLNNMLAIEESRLKDLSHCLPSQESCPECKQKINSEYRFKYQENTTLDKNKFKINITDHKDQLDKLRNKKIKIKQQIKDIDLHINKISNAKNKIDRINLSIDKNISLGKEAKQLAEHVLQEIKTISQNIENLSNQKMILENQLKDSSEQDKSKDILELKSKINVQTQKLKQIDFNLNQNNNQLILLQERITSKSNDLTSLQDLETNRKTLLFDLSVYQEIAQGFGVEIPKAIVYGMLDLLQEKVLSWMEKIRPDFQIIFKIEKKNKKEEDAFHIFYKIDNMEFEWEDISVGEKFMVNLAFKLGLSEVIKDMFGSEILLYAMDELDRNLDVKACNAFIEIIKELEKTAKILIISHNDRIKDKFNHTIKVENYGKANGSCASNLT